MKAFAAKSILFLCTAVSLLACNKEDDPAPAPVPTPESEMHPIEAALDGTYWKQDKICFAFTKQGAHGGIEFTEDLAYEFSWDGGYYYYPKLRIFSVEPDTRKIREYDSGTYIGSYYYHNRYIVEYPDQKHIMIRALDELTGYVGAAFNVDLEVVSCTEQEIILDGPIKPYIWQEWRLDQLADYHDIIYLGIRVYWTKIENGAEILEPSSPLD